MELFTKNNSDGGRIGLLPEFNTHYTYVAPMQHTPCPSSEIGKAKCLEPFAPKNRKKQEKNKEGEVG